MKVIFIFFFLPLILFCQNNPLIKKEVFPFKNPSFEENLKDWGGRQEDNYKTANFYGVIWEVSEIGYDGNKSLSVSLPEYKSTYFYRGFILELGKKYYVSVKAKTEGEITARLRIVYGASGEPYSPEYVGPNSDWKEIGVTFIGTSKGQEHLKHIENYTSLSNCEIRLEVNGIGKAYFDDIRVYELNDYSPYFRIKLLYPDITYKINLSAKIGPPNWFWTKGFLTEGVKSNEFSSWIDLGQFNEFKGRGDAFIGLQILGLKGEKIERIKAIVEFAFQPDEKSIIKRFEMDHEGNVIGLIVPKSENTLFYFLKKFSTIKENAEYRNKFVKSLNLPPINLKHFYIEAHLKGYGGLFTDKSILELEVDTIKNIGFSALDTQYSGLANEWRKTAEKVGILQTHHTFRNFESNLTSRTEDKKYYILNWDEIKGRIEKIVTDWIEYLKKEDEKQIEIIKFIDIGDEIGGFVFAGEDYEEEYRKYLKNNGLKPSDFGKKYWEEVKPYGVWNWRESRKNKPKDKNDINACKNYYWTLKFWNYVNAEVYKIVTETLEKKLPWITTRVNFGPPWLYEYCSYLRGAEIWEFARSRSVSSIWNEDWLNTYGWRHSGIQLCSFLMDLNRSCAKLRNLEANAFVMPEGKENIQLKLASVIGKGAKKIDIYRYGPVYASPDSWSENLDMTEGVARFLRELEKVEDVLFYGKVPETKVAIIWSSSNEVWRETNANTYDMHLVYLALQHSQIPIDFINEKEIEEGKLENYKVAYLLSEYISEKALKNIINWVKNGGFLWFDATSGTGNEYGQKIDILRSFSKIEVKEIKESEILNFNPQSLPKEKAVVGKIKLEDGSEIECVGIKVIFDVKDVKFDNVKVIGRYEDGNPAIIEKQIEKGKIFYAGTYLGLSYSIDVVRKPGKIETGYKDIKRNLISKIIDDSNIEKKVICSVPCLEVNVLESDKGIGVIIANYSGQPQKKVEIKIKTDKDIEKVFSSSSGNINFKKQGSYVEFSIPVNIFDLVALKFKK
ncbi:MAG: beta-galactosidase trimerization domain-containing protein [Candidatus Omnitrophica bacterium]|nr:beta-galactosidase trimerization domain-containing protein [Candidatus Omnitrophota bacterium]